MITKRKKLLGILVFLAVFAAASAVVMLLWNWLIPYIIGWGSVNFWQAAGLLLLCKLLFGGKPGGFHRGHRHRHMDLSRAEKQEMRDAIRSMSRDQRREYIRRHMCHEDMHAPLGTENECG